MLPLDKDYILDIIDDVFFYIKQGSNIYVIQEAGFVGKMFQKMNFMSYSNPSSSQVSRVWLKIYQGINLGDSWQCCLKILTQSYWATLFKALVPHCWSTLLLTLSKCFKKCKARISIPSTKNSSKDCVECHFLNVLNSSCLPGLTSPKFKMYKFFSIFWDLFQSSFSKIYLDMKKTDSIALFLRGLTISFRTLKISIIPSFKPSAISWQWFSKQPKTSAIFWP